jgi:ATPase family associated with various cellular activities (AAA)/AAA lid domain
MTAPPSENPDGLTFCDLLRSWPEDRALTLSHCREALQCLLRQIEERYVGQTRVARRVVQAGLIGGHALLEGLPGEGKTTCVQTYSEISSLRYRRVQFRPDMMPSDLQGMRLLTLTPEGRPELQWVHGAVYTAVMVADEINRAPPKVQAALLECMQERRNSRLDQPLPETLYHPDDRDELLRQQGRSCFSVPVPHPDDSRRVPFVVVATMNPVEMEGTYPLSEAATDRFLFKLLVQRPDPGFYTRIAQVNAEMTERAGSGVGIPGGEGDATSGGGLALWIKTICFFERARQLLFLGNHSVQWRLMNHQRGLWDRLCLILHLTHYRSTRPQEWEEGDEELLAGSLRDRDQEAMAAFLAEWFQGGRGELVRPAVQAMLTRRLFEYVETGSSTRGLLAWPRAAAAEALTEGDLIGEQPMLRRKHFRAVADDVLRHRIRLTPQARADGIRTEHLIHLLVDTLLPESANEDAENAQALLP